MQSWEQTLQHDMEVIKYIEVLHDTPENSNLATENHKKQKRLMDDNVGHAWTAICTHAPTTSPNPLACKYSCLDHMFIHDFKICILNDIRLHISPIY